MRLFVLSLVACLALLALTTWLIITPVYAGSATADCGPGGGSVTCSGSSCGSLDATPEYGGHCSCTKADGSLDIKTCTYKDKAALEEGPVS